MNLADERPTDELTGADALAALHVALVTVSKPADQTLAVRALDVEKVGRWVLLHCRLQRGTTPIEFTVRMPKARARSIYARLGKVIG